jgi:hypothetical protein
MKKFTAWEKSGEKLELAAVKRMLRNTLELLKEADTGYCAALAVLQHGARPINPNDDPLERQVQDLIDDPENKKLADEKYNKIFSIIEEKLDDREFSDLLRRLKPGRPVQ